MNVTRVARLIALGGIAVVTLPPSSVAAQERVADAQGNMHIPSNYQTSYEYLGSWVLADTSGQFAKQLHNVYASRGTIEAYRRLGHFPDGAVLVKELYATETQSMSTGNVRHADKLLGWFLLVKDSKNSYPDNKLWGDGWGWAFFAAGNPQKTTSTDYKKDCQGCHVPAQKTDWIYIQGYAPLHK
jgi:Cytochrome P460